jgi:multidrug efflux system outer membrane protein
MKRQSSLLIALLLGACSLEPRYMAPLPAVPASWPVGDPALKASEAALPALG